MLSVHLPARPRVGDGRLHLRVQGGILPGHRPEHVQRQPGGGRLLGLLPAGLHHLLPALHLPALPAWLPVLLGQHALHGPVQLAPQVTQILVIT